VYHFLILSRRFSVRNLQRSNACRWDRFLIVLLSVESRQTPTYIAYSIYPLVRSTFSWEYFFNRATFTWNLYYTLGVVLGNSYFLYNLRFSILLWNLRYSSTTGSTTCTEHVNTSLLYLEYKSTSTFCTYVLRTTKNRCFFSLFNNHPWYRSEWTIFYTTATARSGDQVDMITINNGKLKLCQSEF
jgi:hypothetical protein